MISPIMFNQTNIHSSNYSIWNSLQVIIVIGFCSIMISLFLCISLVEWIHVSVEHRRIHDILDNIV